MKINIKDLPEDYEELLDYEEDLDKEEEFNNKKKKAIVQNQRKSQKEN